MATKLENAIRVSMDALLDAQLANGAIAASIKKKKNVYHNVYPRDASIVALALDEFGFHGRARKALDFLLSAQLKSGEWAQCYTTEGKLPFHPFLGLTETDNQGLVIRALYEHYQTTRDKEWLKQIFPQIERGLSFVLKFFNPKLNLIWNMAAIHEFPPWEAGYEIWTNSANCDGLFKAAKLARVLGRPDLAKTWSDYAERIKSGILNNLWSEKLGYFQKRVRKIQMDFESIYKIIAKTKRNRYFPLYLLSYIQYYAFALIYLRFQSKKYPPRKLLIDISSLSPAYFDILPYDDPRVVKTIEAIEEFLWDKRMGGYQRYSEGVAPEPGGTNVFFQNGHGPWSIYTAWLAKYYLKSGNKKRAQRCLDWIIDVALKDGLMCEHISRYTGERCAEDFPWGKAEFLLAAREFSPFKI